MKVVLVTGASTGIGRGIAVYFASKGYAVSITARSREGLEETRNLCVAAGCPQDKVVITDGDLTDTTVCERAVQNTIDNLGTLDVLVNNAGFGILGFLAEATVDDFDRQMGLNVRSVHCVTQLALPHLLAVKGRVINISSICSTTAYAGGAFYCMSKAALDMYTKCLALELAPKGVRVNAVNPGVIYSEFQTRAGMTTADNKKEFSDEVAKNSHPLGRAGTPQEVAQTVFFLASEESSFTTGVCLPIDGGATIGRGL